jgi:hypothetical protein
MNAKKKPYQTPELVVHGDLEKITLQAGQPNADVPNGNNNTAYSPG